MSDMNWSVKFLVLCATWVSFTFLKTLPLCSTSWACHVRYRTFVIERPSSFPRISRSVISTSSAGDLGCTFTASTINATLAWRWQRHWCLCVYLMRWMFFGLSIQKTVRYIFSSGNYLRNFWCRFASVSVKPMVPVPRTWSFFDGSS